MPGIAVNRRRQKRADSQYGLKEISPENAVHQRLGHGVEFVLISYSLALCSWEKLMTCVCDSLVFVHGLGSDRVKAWSTKRKDAFTRRWGNGLALKHLEEVNWVSDFLQEDLRPEIRGFVRTYLYGYDSGWMIDAPVVDVHSLARNLLDTIAVQSRSEDSANRRRVIFVAHSHGGLLVKEALVIDSLGGNEDGIASRTDGILFFGTPHGGSTLASLGRVVSAVLGAWGSDADVLGFITPGSKAIWQLHENL
ncbi:MAG: hypothetical protein M1813_005618 [Trichoglossum hirsutum]|nr:MAG: hypothetical protein M1813_005618 [Trichoglossum hirsutum]